MTLSGVKGFSRSFFLALAAGLLVARAVVAGTITVTSTADTTADDGVCTLREAIIAANTNTASGVMLGECAAGAAGAGTDAFALPRAGGGPTPAPPPRPSTPEPNTKDPRS